MCLICDRIAMIKNNNNPWFVKELETGYVVIGDHQHFKGYTLFLYKEHQTELFHLERDKKLKFLEEMSIVAEAVSNAFDAEKINYSEIIKDDKKYKYICVSDIKELDYTLKSSEIDDDNSIYIIRYMDLD